MQRLFIVVMAFLMGNLFIACDGIANNTDATVEEIRIEVIPFSVKEELVGPYSTGAYGEVNLTVDYILAEDATFIDIRNVWEREVFGGYPEGSVVATYQYREEHAKNIAEDKSKRLLNENFVAEVLNLVGGDKHAHIILICASGARTGAKGDREKDSAAKLLSHEGFTHVEHIHGGIWGTGGWRSNNLGWIEQ